MVKGLFRITDILSVTRFFIIIHFVFHYLFRGKGARREGGGGACHCEEALVAIVDTQCCWKLGDMAGVQPSLWHGPFRPPSPSTIQGLLLSDSLPSRLQHSCAGTQLRSPEAKAVSCPEGGWAEGRAESLDDWPWRTLVMWLSRSLKNSGTPSYPANRWITEGTY